MAVDGGVETAAGESGEGAFGGGVFLGDGSLLFENRVGVGVRASELGVARVAEMGYDFFGESRE